MRGDDKVAPKPVVAAVGIQPRSSNPQKPFSLAYRAGPPPLVPTVALCKNNAGVRMAASPSPKLPRNAEKPIQSGSGARVERRRRRRAVFARGDGLIQQRSDF
jgi:hypothetical protein